MNFPNIPEGQCPKRGMPVRVTGLLPVEPLGFPTPSAMAIGLGPPMEKVAIDQLRLVDLQGRPVTLNAYCKEYSLLIFLRHLA